MSKPALPPMLHDRCLCGPPRPAALPAPLLAVVAGLLLAAAAGGAVAAEAAAEAGTPLFRDVAAETGIEFVHFNGMTGDLYFPEVMGPGVALFDADGDGDLDLFLPQGSLLTPEQSLDDAFLDDGLDVPRTDGAPAGERLLRDHLYRNDLSAGGALRFTDVSAAAGFTPAGVGTGGYGMGVATGDYDNDGDVDLYVTNVGSNHLLRNDGAGSFADVTRDAKADDPRWSTSAAFVDVDRDGWLDLFIVNYVDFPIADNPACYAPSSRRDYCGPSSFPPQPDRLLRNRGDGTFEDVSAASGVAAKPGPGLGVVVTDADGDGWPDLYVANDGAANFLWRNTGRWSDGGAGALEETALLAGAAVNGRGLPEAGMGVDAGDFDGDGDQDLFLAHLISESNTLYVNDGSGLYTDRTAAAGLAAPSLGYTGFGAVWLDVDNDGHLDLAVANGAEKILEDLAEAGDVFPLDQPNQLFRNRGDGTFEELSEGAGAAFTRAEVSRGLARGDVDNDGDLDLVVANDAGPVRLFLNQVGHRHPWLGLRLLERSGRDALGARVEVRRDGAPSLWRRAGSDGSFLSAHDPRVLVGLGNGPAPTAVVVHWPDGAVESFPPPPAGAYTTLNQGTAPDRDSAPSTESTRSAQNADEETRR